MVNALRNKERSFVVITHYQRLLDYIVPDYVHVLYKGRIVKSGTKELARTGRKSRLRLDQGKKTVFTFNLLLNHEYRISTYRNRKFCSRLR